MSFDLKTYLSNRGSLAIDSKGQALTQDAATIIALILMEVAGADGRFDNNEINLILKTLARALELTDDAASHTLAVADYLIRQNKGYQDFISKLNERITSEQKETLLGLVTGLISADQEISTSENEALKKFAALLQIENS